MQLSKATAQSLRNDAKRALVILLCLSAFEMWLPKTFQQSTLMGCVNCCGLSAAAVLQ